MSDLKTVDVWELPEEEEVKVKKYEIEFTDDGITYYYYSVSRYFFSVEAATEAGLKWAPKLNFKTFRIVEK